MYLLSVIMDVLIIRISGIAYGRYFAADTSKTRNPSKYLAIVKVAEKYVVNPCQYDFSHL